MNLELHALIGMLVCMATHWYRSRRRLSEKINSIRRRRRFILANMVMARPRPNIRQRRAWKFVNHQSCWEKDIPTWPDVKFQSVFRMSRHTFNEICSDLANNLRKQTTKLRVPISVAKRVAVALFYLKSGADYGVVAMTFGIGKSTVCVLIEEFCNAVLDVYKHTIKFPTTEEEQEKVANGFLKHWQFPNTLSAIDGSHIPIIMPQEFGEDYYNYKGWHSTILMATVDYKYRFTYTNVGFPGRVNDAGVYQTCSLNRQIADGLFNSQYHLIGDGAFPLSQYLMKPFVGNNLPENIEYYNYRLSRARMVVECAFGRLKGRWRVLLKRCDTQFDKAVKIINTCCILHNICENSNELFRHDWLEGVEEFDHMHPQPDQELYNWDGMDGQGKRNALVDLVRDIVLP